MRVAVILLPVFAAMGAAQMYVITAFLPILTL